MRSERERQGSAVDTILRFPSARKRDSTIDAWLSAPPDELSDIVRPWFAKMRACGDDVRELMHDGCPTACVHDAAFAYVNIFRAHANIRALLRPAGSA